jgi:hypothetical protein
MWLLFSPYYLELVVGQFTFVTVSLMFWAYLGWRDKDEKGNGAAGSGPWIADTSVIVGCCLKLIPVLFIPVALLRGRWKAAIAAAFLLSGTSLAYFLRYPQDWPLFAAINFHPHPGPNAANQGLIALLYTVAGTHWQTYLRLRAALLGLLACVLGGLTWVTWRTVREARHGAGTLPPDETPAERAILLLYAALSAGFLLGFKDVWEHHYVVLLPPLVLLALRKEPARLWLPAFLICALPGLFALYDIRSLPVGDDPQFYWKPAVSLLHHAFKPLAPLWLLGAIAAPHAKSAYASIMDRIGRPIPSRKTAANPARRVRALTARVCLAGLALLTIGLWACRAIAEQRAYSRRFTRPAPGYPSAPPARPGPVPFMERSAKAGGGDSRLRSFRSEETFTGREVRLRNPMV